MDPFDFIRDMRDRIANFLDPPVVRSNQCPIDPDSGHRCVRNTGGFLQSPEEECFIYTNAKMIRESAQRVEMTEKVNRAFYEAGIACWPQDVA